jgi:hypothetical protein
MNIKQLVGGAQSLNDLSPTSGAVKTLDVLYSLQQLMNLKSLNEAQ